MNWEQICATHPQQWLLLEATQAHSIGNHRVVEQLAVVESFSDSTKALQRYSQLHRQAPARELYVFHTSRKQLDITERQWLGVRNVGWVKERNPALPSHTAGLGSLTQPT